MHPPKNKINKVFEDYGDNPSSLYLDHHGFVPDYNPFDCASLRLHPSDPDGPDGPSGGVVRAGGAGGVGGVVPASMAEAEAEAEMAVRMEAQRVQLLRRLKVPNTLSV